MQYQRQYYFCEDCSNWSKESRFVFIQPVQFLRYLENGGEIDILDVFNSINNRFIDTNNCDSLLNLITLKKKIVKEIVDITKLPVVEAWDEAGLLMEWAADQIPFTDDSCGLNPKSLYNSETRMLENAGSALTVACRLANESPANTTIFCGTALRLAVMEAHIPKSLKNLVKISTDNYFKSYNVLKMWDKETVLQSLEEDLNLKELKMNNDIVSYLLQGRPRLTSLFKTSLEKN